MCINIHIHRQLAYIVFSRPQVEPEMQTLVVAVRSDYMEVLKFYGKRHQNKTKKYKTIAGGHICNAYNK